MAHILGPIFTKFPGSQMVVCDAGTVEDSFSAASFKSPTTIAKYEDRMLVVNSQFGARESGNPELPFTVSDISIP